MRQGYSGPASTVLHMVKRGTNLRVVQEVMGDKDLKITSLYVGLAREQMNKEMQEHAL